MAVNTSSKTLNYNSGKVLSLKRTWLVNPGTSAPTQFKLRSGGDIPSVNSDFLGDLVPINDGVIIDNCDDVTGWSAVNGDVNLNTLRRVKGVGSLNLTKTSNTDLVVSTSKTQTSFDLTDSKVFLFVYVNSEIIPLLEWFEIRLKVDASNYIYKNIVQDDMSAGWNYVKITESDSVVGSPDLTSLTITEVAFKTLAVETVTSDGDFAFDDFKKVVYNDFRKNLTGGFPEVDVNNREVTIRGVVNSTEANGFIIDGWCITNTDDPEVHVVADLFPGESKSNTDEFTFIRKNRRL